MRIKKTSGLTTVWLCACILQFLTAPAFATESEEINKRTWYLGAGLGITELDPDTGNTGYSLTDERDTGFKLFAGFDYSDRLTIEAFYADMGSAQLGNHVIKPDGAVDYSTLGASALWYFWRNANTEGSTLRNGLQAYVHGGLSFLDNSSSVDYTQDNSVQVQYGAGFEYGLNDGLALRAGIDLYDKDAGMVFVGVMKRFGTKSKRKVIVEPEPIMQPVIEPIVEPVPAQVIIMPEVVVVADVDSDKDGVIDRLDECADSPSDMKVDTQGCSIIAIELDGVTFESKSFELTEESKIILDEAVVTISASPELQIEVQAHTDYKGSGKLNLQLSEQRALSVKAYLVSKGVNENQLIAKGYGESQPIADNKTEEGRAKNRRVELKIVKDDVIKKEKQEVESAGESVLVSEDTKVEDTIKTEEGIPEVETIIDTEKQSSETEVKQ